MTFRTRLTLFFLLLVVVPIAAAAVVVYRLIDDSQNGKANARVAAGLAAAAGYYRQAAVTAEQRATGLVRDPTLSQALRAGDARAVSSRMGALRARENLARVRIATGPRQLVDVGSAAAIAPASTQLISPTGTPMAQIEVSQLTAPRYLSVLQSFGLHGVVRGGAGTLATDVPGLPAHPLPVRGAITASGRRLRVATFAAPGFGGDRLRISVLSPVQPGVSAVPRNRLLAGVVLVGFLILALACALAISRALQSQIARFLEAARRMAHGDFSTEVPTDGHDEFAALGAEFNKMSRELERRVEELGRERARLGESIRRVGEAFASNLDRGALFDLGLHTAVDAVRGTCGRTSVRGSAGTLVERERLGPLEDYAAAVHAAEAEALESRSFTSLRRDGASVLCAPLEGRGDGVVGVLTVVRDGKPYADEERRLFDSLVGQAGVSMENVDLHDQVKRQAVTDGLTGLTNHRRFDQVLDAEIERARRYGNDLSLLMLDVDDFKRVNDAYGHPRGDAVLREVAAVLRANSRDVDEAARYGGEEMALVLPQTSLEGAYAIAERVRHAIAAIRVSVPEHADDIQVTASIGVAASASADKESLIAAADTALYEAKRAGKNRTVRVAVEPAAAVAGE